MFTHSTSRSMFSQGASLWSHHGPKLREELPRVVRAASTGRNMADSSFSRATVAGAAAIHGAQDARHRLHASLRIGPSPVWDELGIGGAFRPRTQALNGRRLESGKLQRVVWVCWTGSNVMPAHLRLCLETIRRNAGLPVVAVTPANMVEYVPDPHPLYPFLHLAHRADYLRCYLLHHYGGIYLDVDTICLKSLEGLFSYLDKYDAIGYDGSQWGEYIGISCMGPFLPQTDITTLWFNALHGKLESKLSQISNLVSSSQGHAELFYWQEILRDVFLPVSLIHKDRIGVQLMASNPSQEHLWSIDSYANVLSDALDLHHILVLNNANYGHELKHLSAEEILSGPAVLSQLLRESLGVVDDKSFADVLRAVGSPL